MYDIKKIAYRLNNLSQKYRIGNLQEIRKEIKGFDRRPGSVIFRDETISSDNDWAFHFGGRKELQFNIGVEEEGLRFGVAFSLEPSRTLTNISLLFPKILKYNQYVRGNIEKYYNYKMWYWENGKRSSIYNITEITKDMMKKNNFIFIGKISRSINYEKILKTFDNFLDMYLFIESEVSVEKPTEETTFAFIPTKPELIKGRRYSTVEKEISLDVRHSILQSKLYKLLVTDYGENNVAVEMPLYGKKIDVVVKRNNSYIFFEIKTNGTVKECIRSAFGQIMEYAYWPGLINANKLIIVGEHEIDKKTNKYLNFIKEEFGIPIEYMKLDID